MPEICQGEVNASLTSAVLSTSMRRFLGKPTIRHAACASQTSYLIQASVKFSQIEFEEDLPSWALECSKTQVFLTMFIESPWFPRASTMSSKIAMFISDLVPFWPGIFRNVFKTIFSAVGAPSKLFFLAKNPHFLFLNLVNFQKNSYPQKLYFRVAYFEEYLIRVVRMDHADHLGFR